jgi:hypothetical protein
MTVLATLCRNELCPVCRSSRFATIELSRRDKFRRRVAAVAAHLLMIGILILDESDFDQRGFVKRGKTAISGHDSFVT